MYIIYHLASRSIFLVFVTVLKKARPSDDVYYRCHSQGMRRPGWHTSKAGEKGVRDIICGANARIAWETNDVGANVSIVRGRQTPNYRMPPIRFILTILMLRYLGTSWISGSRCEVSIPLTIYMYICMLLDNFIRSSCSSWWPTSWTGLGRIA